MLKLKRKSIILISLLVIIGLCTTGCSGGNQDPNGSNQTKPEITIGKDPFSYDWIPVYVFEQIAQELGYPTKIVEGEVGFMWLGLAEGDVDVWPDVWLPILHKTYKDKYKDRVESANNIIDQNPMGLAVPSYVDINSIAELNARAKEFNNRIVGIEAGGMMLTAEETIRAYGLTNFELIQGSTPAMMAEVDRATRAKEPIVFLGWRPHTMFQKYDIKLLEDPKGVWEYDAWISGVNPGLKEKAPDFYNFVKNFKISSEEVEAILIEYEKSGNEEVLKQETRKWVEDNRDKINTMLGK